MPNNFLNRLEKWYKNGGFLYNFFLDLGTLLSFII